MNVGNRKDLHEKSAAIPDAGVIPAQSQPAENLRNDPQLDIEQVGQIRAAEDAAESFSFDWRFPGQSGVPPNK